MRMSDQCIDDTERLESYLERVGQEWQKAVEEGDEKGAAYALGKKSAFITAIEETNDCIQEADSEQLISGGASDGD